MTRKKALYISTMWPPLSQGGEEFTNQENFDILSSDLDIDIITSLPEVSPGYSRTDLPKGQLNIHRVLEWGEKGGSERNIERLNKLVATVDPDLLLVGHPYGFGTALDSHVKQLALKKIFFLGDISYYQAGYYSVFPGDYFLDEFCVFVSDFTKNCLEQGKHSYLKRSKKFSFCDDKCFTVYLDEDIKNPVTDITEFGICSLGRFDKWKGFDTLVSSAITFKYTDKVTIYGDGEFRKQFSAYVKCPGWLSSSEKYKALRRHSVFVFPSKYHETFGRTWLEAASVGMPLIVSDIEVMKEVIPKGSAVMFRAGDPADLARAVREMSDPANREQYQKKSLALASSYSRQRREAELKKIVATVLAA